MKTKLLSAILLSAMLAASCSKENSSPEPGAVEGAETFMSLTIDRARANTRAHYGDLDATDAESVINDVTIYILDKNDFLEKTVNFPSGTSTQTFTITTGPKTFLAAVNIPSLPNFANGTTHISEIQAVTLNVADIGVPVFIDPTNPSTDSNIWMTTLDDTNIADLIELDEASVPNSVNDVEIKVGRAVAKVGVYYNPSQTPADGDIDASSVVYKAANNPDKMMLFPSVNSSGYRVTPYMSTTGSYFDNADYLTTGLDSNNEHEYPSYIMENSNVNVSNDNASFVYVRGEYRPLQVIDPDDGSLSSYTPGTSFWRIAKMVSGKRDSWQAGYYSKDPDVSVNSSSTVTLAVDEQSFEYSNGEAYYGLWLMNDQESGTVNRYTVKRNQYWSVEITSVSGCGEPDENGVKEGPDPEAETYMRASITVEGWESVERPGGI